MREALVVGCVSLLVLSFAGCGDSGLTCDVLADPDNCWARASSTLRSCLPADGMGVFDADRRVCTFGDGSEVFFASALPASEWDLADFALDVERDGERCARFVDTGENRMELTVGDDTVVLELLEGNDFVLRCPGGSTYRTSFEALFDCAAEGVPLPTGGLTFDGNAIDFALSSVLTRERIFRCSPAL